MAKTRMSCLGMMLVLCVASCGGNDDDETGGNNGAVSVENFLTKCRAYCDALTAQNCNTYGSADACKDQFCGQTSSTVASCAAAINAYGDCLGQQSNACNARAACASSQSDMAAKC